MKTTQSKHKEKGTTKLSGSFPVIHKNTTTKQRGIKSMDETESLLEEYELNNQQSDSKTSIDEELLEDAYKHPEDNPVVGIIEKTDYKHVHRHVYELLHYNDLPPYLKDNHFIHTGYRVDFSLWLCFKSLFSWHNESLCIWTHLLAAIGFAIMTPITLNFLLHEPSSSDKYIFLVFLVVAQLQMGFSAIFHTFGCSSPNHLQQLAKLDYVGISIMIAGSNYPPLYYGFFCWPKLAIFYLTTISIFGILGIFVSCINVFSTPPYRLYRLGFFLAFGFFGIFPVPHLIYLNGNEFSWPIIWREICMGALYTIGAFFYGTRWPESKYPGKFDRGMASHVIWHIFTILAAMMQLWACIVAFNQRAEHTCGK